MVTVNHGWTTSQLENLSRTLKAIAHPARLAIIDLLEGGKPMAVTEIYTHLDADQSAVSHHLSIMRSREVLSCERVGKYMYYSLKKGNLTNLIDCVSGVPDQPFYASSSL